MKQPYLRKTKICDEAIKSIQYAEWKWQAIDHATLLPYRSGGWNIATFYIKMVILAYNANGIVLHLKSLRLPE